MAESSGVKLFRDLFSLNDLIFAGLLVVVIALIIVPLPPVIMDVLIAGNIAISLIVLLVSLFLKEPLDFAAFPSVLLFVTLYRVSINIAASRLILLNGYAGEVIASFGNFVVAGNFIVGVIVYIIITVVQFIVITKGSERVAEVAARFTLDAMPGKQMSIDADLNAGLIDANEAKNRRKKIEKESTFFGAMDGSNKFVRGDSIASIVITIVNLIGGILIGWLQRGLDIMSSIQTYSLLTVGCGLVIQIPALLVSVATGMIITKAATDESIGSDIGKELFAQPRAFAFVAIMLAAFALVPGLPTIPFMTTAFGAGLVTILLLRSQLKKEEVAMVSEEATQKDALKKPESIISTLTLDPLSIKTGRNLIPMIDPAKKGPLLEKITLIRYHIGQELGFVIPGVRVMDDLSLPPNQYVIEIRGTKVATGEVLLDHLKVDMPPEELKSKNISGIEGRNPIDGDIITWVPASEKQKLDELGIQSKDAVDVVADHFSETIKRYADEIITRQNVQSLVELVKNTNAAIVRELIPDMLSLGQVHKVLQLLVRERVSIRDLSTILERLADYAHLSRDINILAEYVRQSLARQICETYANKDDVITVITIDPNLEETMIGAVHQSEYGSFLALDPSIGERILNQIASQIPLFKKMGLPSVILCSPRLRPHLKRFIERSFPDTAVLSYNEIVPQVKVQSIGMVSLD